MTYEQFNAAIVDHSRPVILLEGTRDIPEGEASRMVAFAKWLAETCPHAIFRSGNAKGSDEAFANGVKAVDPDRLELVLPTSGHRQANSGYPVRSVALNELSIAAEESAAYLTGKVSPIYDTMLEKRHRIPRVRAMANYLIRDTAKVTGIPEAGLSMAVFGIFYVNTADPMKGGTGHTVRVCRSLGVPVAFQDEWMHWQRSKQRGRL